MPITIHYSEGAYLMMNLTKEDDGKRDDIRFNADAYYRCETV